MSKYLIVVIYLLFIPVQDVQGQVFNKKGAVYVYS